MPYSSRVKRFAYTLDRKCWQSYSGADPEFKRRMEPRRVASLNAAQRYIDMMDRLAAFPSTKPESPTMSPSGKFYIEVSFPQTPRINAPMKISMLLHFYSVCEPYAPEQSRTSRAYTKFVRELLSESLIERTTDEQKRQCPGWAYRTTDKGKALVEAICSVPNPVASTVWTVPAKSSMPPGFSQW